MIMRYAKPLWPALTLIVVGCGPAEESTERAVGSARSDVTVTPNTDLLSDDLVRVVASGFAHYEQVRYGQCPVEYIDFPGDCILNNGGADSEGTLSAELPVFRYFTVQYDHGFSCSEPGSCVAGVFPGSTFAEARVAPLSFRDVGPVPPLPSPLAISSVSGNGDLISGQTVNVNVRNLAEPGSPFVATMRQCRTGTDVSSPFYLEWPEADCEPRSQFSEGTVANETPIPFTVQYTIEPSGGPPVNCGEPGSCSVYMKNPGVERMRIASAPLTFRELAPARAGTLQLESTTWVQGKIHQISGSGWAPYAAVAVDACPAGSTNDACQQRDIHYTDAEGKFAGQFGLGGTALFHREGPHDCTAAPGACVIRAYELRAPTTAKVDVPITMLTEPSLRGSLQLELRSPLIDGLTVRLRAADWSPNSFVQLWLCKGAGNGFRPCME
ncbi:MAG TPA: hypothetical protein VK524_04570, partial [Polyangiaceae bacterium]|nr:hypothetical protein [Polyangiaceae bacterium]